MITLSMLYKLRCQFSVRAHVLAGLTDIQLDRLRNLEPRAKSPAKKEPWFDEAVKIARILTGGSVWGLIAPWEHADVENQIQRLLPHDLEHFQAGRRVPLSLAMRVAWHFALSDPSELVVTPYQMQLWSMLEAGERNTHAYGICPWCGVDRFPTSGGRAEHETWCAPNNLWSPRVRPTQLEPLKPMLREPGKFISEPSRIAHGLKALRFKAGETQVHVADAVGVHRSHYPKIERGDQRCPHKLALKLAGHFGVPVESIYEGV